VPDLSCSGRLSINANVTGRAAKARHPNVSAPSERTRTLVGSPSLLCRLVRPV
jgi:hypothetical protein